MTHDYKRNGTTDLFAALNVGTGEVLHQLRPHHRAAEFKKFLQAIDKAVPAGLDVHVVLDNSSTHKTDAVNRWLVQHPRFHFHFTPTSSSWLNLVERWFAELARRLLQRSAPQRQRPHHRPQRLDCRMEREPTAFRLAQVGRRDPRESPEISTADL